MIAVTSTTVKVKKEERRENNTRNATLHFEVASYNMEESGRRRHLLSRVAMK